MRNIVMLLLFVLFLSSCSQPEPRKPVSVKTGSFFKESVERNKQLLASEQGAIQQLINKDTLNNYIESSNGFWYYYNTVDSTDNYLPKEDDLATLTYNIRTLNNEVIYSEEEIGTLQYKVDKQELFPGLRAAVKLLRKGEKATFFFPSSLGYGYHGDNNKIETNVPLISTITLINIEKSNQ